MRNMTASYRGMQLRNLRYGPETEQLVAEALERDSWPPDKWNAYQEERLGYVLHRSATQVPFYRRQWAERRRSGDRSSWEYLENWPILSKDELRRNPRAFICDDVNPNSLVKESTSGTTGKPLQLWWSRKTAITWYALFEARLRRWHEVNYHDRWAILGGQLIAPSSQKKPPFWVWNRAMNQLYLSSYHLAPQYMQYYLQALEKYRIRYIYAYTSSVTALAQEILRNHHETRIDLKVILTNAEPLYEHQREMISHAFNCSVRETYGMSEIVTAASECEHGSLHLWPDVGITEIIEGTVSVKKGSPGQLVGTGFINEAMPLVRYEVGDRAWLCEGNHVCRCGRSLPIVGGIEGRTDDVLYTTDGRRVGRLDPVFKASIAVREAQIIQESIQRIRVRYVPEPGYTDSDGASISERLRERLGPVEVILEPVAEIERSANGKFRSVVCNLSREDRQEMLSAHD